MDLWVWIVLGALLVIVIAVWLMKRQRDFSQPHRPDVELRGPTAKEADPTSRQGEFN